MKIPEPLFKIINPTLGLLLRSPAHFHGTNGGSPAAGGLFLWRRRRAVLGQAKGFLMSRSLLLITFTGVRSGRSYSTPLRYVRDGKTIRCFTSKETRWWRNLRKEARVWLTLQGVGVPYQASVIVDEPDRIRQLLIDYLRQHPGDAAYHDVAVSKAGDLSESDLDRATGQAVVMEARPA